jgi:small GTP-binding protein
VGEKVTVSTHAKVVVLGEEKVGKTSLIKCYCMGNKGSEQAGSHFDEEEQMTLDASAFRKYEYLGAKEDQEMIIDIWDTAGQERYRQLNQAYIRGCHGALVIYDANDDSSECFKNIKR